MKTKQIFLRIFQYTKIIILAFIPFIFISCSKDRIMDRHDERIMSSTEDHYNLYNNFKTKTISTINNYKNIPVPNAQETFFQYKNLNKIEPLNFASKDFSDNYAIISVCWKKSPPVLRFWTRFMTIAKWIDVSTTPIIRC